MTPGIDRQKFVFNMSRREYEQQFGKAYRRPGVFVRILTFLYKVVPKIGPFKYFGFRAPSPEAERLFLESFKDTRDRFRQSLVALGEGRLDLPNTNFDTGRPTSRGCAISALPPGTTPRGSPACTGPSPAAPSGSVT